MSYKATKKKSKVKQNNVIFLLFFFFLQGNSFSLEEMYLMECAFMFLTLCIMEGAVCLFGARFIQKEGSWDVTDDEGGGGLASDSAAAAAAGGGRKEGRCLPWEEENLAC